jgi:large repetitive protein
MTASGGASAGAPSTGGSGTSGAAGSVTAGAAGSDAGGVGGSGGSGGGTGGAGGKGGSGGGSTAGAGGASGGSSGGAGNCIGAGHALSLSANGTGAAADTAKARVEINLMSDLPIGNSNRTIELWAYMRMSDWAGNTNTLFFYGPFPSARNADGFGLDFGGTLGTIDPFTNAFFDNDNQASGVTAATSQWVHFAMTWDGTQVQAYVNGVLKSTKVSDNATQKTLMTGSSVFTIGGYPGENAYFASFIDEFRVWNVVHTAAQILATKDKTLVGNEAGLVGYWQFNEASGTTAADSSGHMHPGTLLGTPVATFALPAPAAPVTCP